MSLPAFSDRDRLLVVAPHPDDETIAAGIAIQSALAAGAAVRVVHATDGDNNPWPQRWIERRLFIGPAERARWGRVRRAEAERAHAALAPDGCRIEARFFGWPDQGLTEALMRDDAAVAMLAEEIVAFAPSQVLMPALDDDHPDHSALHVITELAALRAGIACARHAYLVHGGGSEAPEADAERLARKRCALEAYASQLSLSRARLDRFARRAERFEPVAGGLPATAPAGIVRAPLGALAASPHRHELLLVLALRGGRVLRLRGHWPRFARGDRRVRLHDEHGCVHDAEVSGSVVRVEVGERVLAAFAKCHRAGPRIVVFDRTRWRAAGGEASTATATFGIARGIG